MSLRRVLSAVGIGLMLCSALLAGGCGPTTHVTCEAAVSLQEILFADSATGIQAFFVNAGTGALTPMATTSDASLSRNITGNMVLSAQGKFLLVCDFTDTLIKVFSVDSTNGALAPVAGSPFAIGGAGGGSIALDPSGQFVYAAYAQGVAGFRFNSSTGELTPLGGSPFSDGSVPNAVAADPSGKFVYTTGSTAKAGFSVYSLNSTTGALTPVAGSPFATPLANNPYNLAVIPTGGTVYATVPSNNAVLGLSINGTTGVPGAVPGSPFAAINSDMFLGLDPAGKFLYTCNEGNGEISAYTINSSNGALSPIAGGPFGSNNCDTTVIVEPINGQYLYAANPGANAITGFSVNTATGALSMISGSPFTATDATLLAIAAYGVSACGQ